MIATPRERIRQRCDRLAAKLADKGVAAHVTQSNASVGAGAFPTDSIESCAVIVESNDPMVTQSRLRNAEIPVIGRINDGNFGPDLRTVPERFDDLMFDAVARALS